MVSRAPEDPTEHEKWVRKLARVQVAMWIDHAICEECGYKYKSVDDFMRCNPRNGLAKKTSITFVCSGCWNEYKKNFKGKDK